MHRGVGTGLRRRAKLLRKGPMDPPAPIHAWVIEHPDGPGPPRRRRRGRRAPPAPIHAWVIEHPDGPILVDTGSTHRARDAPFATFHVTRADELDHQLAGAGFDPADVATVVLTHIHG